MPEKKTCEFYLAINEEGDYSVHEEADGVAERLTDDWGGACRRIIKFTVRVTPPVLDEAEVDVADDAGETETVETEAK